MFLIGISGSILPYLVLLGIVLVLSVQADSHILNNAVSAGFDSSDKQLVYEFPEKTESNYAVNALFVDFYSEKNCRDKCSGKQPLFSFVELLSVFTETGLLKRSYCFFSRLLTGQQTGFRFSGLSPPLSGLLY